MSGTRSATLSPFSGDVACICSLLILLICLINIGIPISAEGLVEIVYILVIAKTLTYSLGLLTMQINQLLLTSLLIGLLQGKTLTQTEVKMLSPKDTNILSISIWIVQ